MLAALAALVALGVLLALAPARTAGPPAALVHLRDAARAAAARAAAARIARARGAAARAAIPPAYGVDPAPASERVTTRLTFHLSSGILFDAWTGRVLWQHDPSRRLPIASLTKLMTALVVAQRGRPSDRVLITRQAVDFSGSGVGLLPLGKYVTLRSLLYGMLLPSGNDAATALAQHVAGTQAAFVALMNQRAHEMRLGCTHFASPSGLVDSNNYSCTADLAVMAHAVLAQPLLAPVVASRSAVIPFPINGGRLYLYNNNPLLLMRYPGADGVKTGYTQAAGPCLIATARRGRAWLGVVLLHSANPPLQAQKLLDAGFAKFGVR